MRYEDTFRHQRTEDKGTAWAVRESLVYNSNFMVRVNFAARVRVRVRVRSGLLTVCMVLKTNR